MRIRLRQKAVLWEVGSYDRDGELKVATNANAEEIKCRWETGDTSSKSSQSDTVAIDATVIVKQRIELGSLMWLGELVDLQGTNFEDEDEGLMEVVTSREIPYTKARQTYYEVGLARFRDTMPTQE